MSIFEKVRASDLWFYRQFPYEFKNGILPNTRLFITKDRLHIYYVDKGSFVKSTSGSRKTLLKKKGYVSDCSFDMDSKEDIYYMEDNVVYKFDHNKEEQTSKEEDRNIESDTDFMGCFEYFKDFNFLKEKLDDFEAYMFFIDHDDRFVFMDDYRVVHILDDNNHKVMNIPSDYYGQYLLSTTIDCHNRFYIGNLSDTILMISLSDYKVKRIYNDEYIHRFFMLENRLYLYMESYESQTRERIKEEESEGNEEDESKDSYSEILSSEKPHYSSSLTLFSFYFVLRPDFLDILDDTDDRIDIRPLLPDSNDFLSIESFKFNLCDDLFLYDAGSPKFYYKFSLNDLVFTKYHRLKESLVHYEEDEICWLHHLFYNEKNELMTFFLKRNELFRVCYGKEGKVKKEKIDMNIREMDDVFILIYYMDKEYNVYGSMNIGEGMNMGDGANLGSAKDSFRLFKIYKDNGVDYKDYSRKNIIDLHFNTSFYIDSFILDHNEQWIYILSDIFYKKIVGYENGEELFEPLSISHKSTPLLMDGNKYEATNFNSSCLSINSNGDIYFLNSNRDGLGKIRKITKDGQYITLNNQNIFTYLHIDTNDRIYASTKENVYEIKDKTGNNQK